MMWGHRVWCVPVCLSVCDGNCGKNNRTETESDERRTEEKNYSNSFSSIHTTDKIKLILIRNSLEQDFFFCIYFASPSSIEDTDDEVMCDDDEYISLLFSLHSTHNSQSE